MSNGSQRTLAGSADTATFVRITVGLVNSEKVFEKNLIKTAKDMGYWPIKLNPTWNKGLPDRLFLGPNRTIVFMELKTPIGKASKMQKFYISRLKEFGFNAQFVDNLPNAIRILESARLSETGHPNDARSIRGWPVFRSWFRKD